MRLPRRTRCPATNSYILLGTLAIAFLLLLLRNTEEIKNKDGSSELGRVSYLDNTDFLESMKLMFSTSGTDKATFRNILKTPVVKDETVYSVFIKNVNKDGGQIMKNHPTINYENLGVDLSDINYDVEFPNITSEDNVMTSVSSIPSHNHSRDVSTTEQDIVSRTEQDIVSRTEQVEKQCQKLSVFGTPDNEVREIMTNRVSRLAYCFVPKCGCTFWKRVIRFLNRDYKGRNVTSPFQIRRLETHSYLYSNPDSFLPFRVFRKIDRAYRSFMFVREPYARLWSAYVDKFYLPDFWSNFKEQIISKRYPSYSKRCVNDVTFQEFVSLSLTTQEPHWDPIHQMCDPCTFKPTVVGRVETFTSDTQYILKQANLSWIMDGYDHAMHVQEELATLINYNFELIAVKPYIGRCINKAGMFRRLWKTFQINGYLPADAIPPHLDKTTTVPEFIQIVIDQYRRRPNTPDVWRKQRKEFMIAAYKTISTGTLHDLRMKYARDFLLFNYDPRPVEIFRNRH